MNYKKLGLVVVLGLMIALVFAFDVPQYLNLETLQNQQSRLATWRDANFLLLAAAAFLIYVGVTALSIPGAAVMTLAVGAIFGFGWGLLIASFASTIGATLAFLAARFLFRDWVQSKFSKRLELFDKRFSEDGAFYLLTLRLLPVFPFFLINLVMGLTRIKIWTYYWVSQVGMLAGTAVYVNAGTQLATIERMGDIFSLRLVLSFSLLALFPLIAKGMVAWIKRRKALRGYRKPKQFDRNLVVIGAGAAGLVSSYIAATVKAKVTLVEAHKMGGDCLNTGCVPSKALIQVAKHAQQARLGGMGIPGQPNLQIDFATTMAHVHEVIQTIEPHDSIERYTGLGVDVVQGYARIISPWEVEIETAEGTQTLTTRSIIVATGASPFVPDIPGLQDVPYLTSENLWSLKTLPKRLVVMGAGPIGCELAQAFARLGSQVTLLEAQERILPREDQEVAELVASRLEAEGVTLALGAAAREFHADEQSYSVTLDGREERISFDQILVAVGRKANLRGFGLEALGIDVERPLMVNGWMQTEIPTIYAAGDVAGPYQFTHVAAHQAWYASVNSLFSPFKRFVVDYRVIPWATFTDPEIATVGLTETAAQKQSVDYEVTRYDLEDLDRAIADHANYGFVKVLTVPGKDKILGATIVGPRASDLIAEFVLAMKHKIGLNQILGTIHIYPTMNEANKYVAGEWRKARKPEKLLQLVERFHRWRRGGKTDV